MSAPSDPRSEAEKARAALKRNAEMDSGTVFQAPYTRQPSVTPATFGEHGSRARALSGSDQGLEAGGATPPGGPGSEDSPSIAEAEQVLSHDGNGADERGCHNNRKLHRNTSSMAKSAPSMQIPVGEFLYDCIPIRRDSG